MSYALDLHFWVKLNACKTLNRSSGVTVPRIESKWQLRRRRYRITNNNQKGFSGSVIFDSSNTLFHANILSIENYWRQALEVAQIPYTAYIFDMYPYNE